VIFLERTKEQYINLVEKIFFKYNMSGSILEKTYIDGIKNSNFRYSNFSMSKIKEFILEENDLANSYFQECEMKNTYISKSDFINTQFFRTKLNKIDFSDSNIEGIVVAMEDVKGMIVSEFQALELSKLLGINIKT
jgi:uncharacterized protein YjbI with pentapeptide repeats